MQLGSQLVRLAAALTALGAATVTTAQTSPPPPANGLFNNRIIYPGGPGLRPVYPRYVELEDGTLLVTASVFGQNSFPVFESKDGGWTWSWISNITDQVNGWGLSAQPALLELLEPMGGYDPGTVLASGNSWSGTGTRIDVYASKNKGRSWEFVSRVTEGGRPNTTNGATPVWEPFLMTYDHKLVCYYSDQRDPLHGQKLSHQESSDLKTWGPIINDVRYPEYLARPGMSVVAEIKAMKKWILTYERPIGNSSSYGSNYPVHYRIADNPLEFDAAESIPIVIQNATDPSRSFVPNASPYVVWSPVGGCNGTIIVSDADRPQVFINRFGGAPDKWESKATPQPEAYSRALHIFRKYPDRLMVLGGATFDGLYPYLSLSVIGLTELFKAGQS